MQTKSGDQKKAILFEIPGTRVTWQLGTSEVFTEG